MSPEVQNRQKDSRAFPKLTIPTAPTWQFCQPLPTIVLFPLLQVMLHKMLLNPLINFYEFSGNTQSWQCWKFRTTSNEINLY